MLTLLKNVILRLGSKVLVLLSIIFIMELLFLILSGNYVIRMYTFNVEFIKYYNIELSYIILTSIIIIFIYFFFSLNYEERRTSYLRFIINFFGSFISLPLGYLIYKSEIAKEYVLINIKGLISISRYMSLEEKIQYVKSCWAQVPDQSLLNTPTAKFIKDSLFNELPYLQTKQDIYDFLVRNIQLVTNAESVNDILSMKLKNSLVTLAFSIVILGFIVLFQNRTQIKYFEITTHNVLVTKQLINEIDLLKKSSNAIKIELDIIKHSIRELQHKINNL